MARVSFTIGGTQVDVVADSTSELEAVFRAVANFDKQGASQATVDETTTLLPSLNRGQAESTRARPQETISSPRHPSVVRTPSRNLRGRTLTDANADAVARALEDIGHPAPAPDILDALDRLNLEFVTTGKNVGAAVRSAMRRDARKRFTKIGGNWGLATWAQRQDAHGAGA